MMQTFWQDIRYAVRILTTNAVFSTLAVVTLALGIGANTAIFSLVNAVLLRPLPGVEDADRLLSFERIQTGRKYYNFSYPDYLDYRDQNRSFSGLAAHVATPLSLAGATTERLRGAVVTGNYFSVLGVKAATGRLLQPGDDVTVGAHPLAVVSYGFWQRTFGADPGVIGESITLNGHNFLVIGVAAEGFGGTSVGPSTDVWVPMAMQPQAIPRMSPGVLSDRSAGWIGITGRLNHQVGLEQAQAEMTALARNVEQAYPGTNMGRSLALTAGLGLTSEERTSFRRFLGLLLACVGLLLLIACGNVANLLMVRTASRRREIAIRLALGASRGRLVRQLLTEGLLLSLLASGVGLLLAPWATRLVLAFQQPAYDLRGLGLGLDTRVLAFTLALALLTGIFFGLAPALQSSNPDLTTALKDGAPAGGPHKSRLQGLLVVAQVALSLALLICAGLVVRTMQKVLTLDKGFDTDRRLLLSLDLSIQGYSPEAGRSFYEQLIRRLGSVPGVTSASFAKTVPPNDWSDRLSVFYEGQEPPPDALRADPEMGIRVDLNRIAPNYFRTLGIPLLQGRDFKEVDREGAPLVAVVNEKLAEKLWPGESPLGRRLSAPFLGGPARPPVEIIGVARDTRYRTLLDEAPPILYLPVLQAYDGRTTLVIHTAGEPAALTEAVRAEVGQVDKHIPLFAVKSMSDQVATTLWQQRMAAGLIGVFGGLSLLLAAIGIYGVISHSVTERTRETGVRVALGASPGAVVKLFIRRGVRLALIGVVLGVVAGFSLTRLMTGLLYGVGPTDPAIFIGASVLLLAVALSASYIPARRATKVDPMVALRHE